ncbi:MAG: LacI family DNA-binding transcriptional regulator [Cellulosilyticaceae bacterium]
MGATISDIAKSAGVSLATVSRVLNDSGYVKEATRERVMQAIEEADYVPSAIARGLSKNETNTIGVIIPDITNPHFGEIIKGISDVADQNGLNMVLFDTNDELERELKALTVAKEQRLKGVIIAPMFGEEEIDSRYLQALESLDMPIVLVEADIKYTNLSGVFVDDIQGGFDATNILIKEGHEKIGIITGLLSSEPAMQRLMGYKKALLMNDIPYNEEYVFKGDFRLSTGYKFAKEIMMMEDAPTALIICSNRMALGVIKAVVEEGKKIPEDLAMVAFNKIDFVDIVGIHISYLEEDTIRVGKEAMQILCEAFNNKNKNTKNRITMSHNIILKGSEKKIQKSK